MFALAVLLVKRLPNKKRTFVQSRTDSQSLFMYYHQHQHHYCIFKIQYHVTSERVMSTFLIHRYIRPRTHERCVSIVNIELAKMG